MYVGSVQRAQMQARDLVSSSDDEDDEASGASTSSPTRPLSVVHVSAKASAPHEVAIADSVSTTEDMMEPSTSSQLPGDGEDGKILTRAQREKLKQEEIRRQETVGPSPMLQAPFMTVGEQVIIKPLDPHTLNSILSGCPPPQKNPQAAISYLKRTTKGLNYTGEDYKLIIQGVMGYDELYDSEFDWAQIPKLHDLDKVYPSGEYPFRKQGDIKEMWDKVLEIWIKEHGDKKNIGPVVICKQLPKEEVSTFIRSFRKVWTEEAGLGKGNGLELVYVQTLMNAFRPEIARTIKQMIDSWHTLEPKKLEDSIMLKDSAGCFDYGKSTIQAFQYRGNRDNQDRVKGKFPLRRDSEEQKRNRCFECGLNGHWKMECPNRRKKYYNNNPQQNMRQTFPRAVRYPIDWQNKRNTQ